MMESCGHCAILKVGFSEIVFFNINSPNLLSGHCSRLSPGRQNDDEMASIDVIASDKIIATFILERIEKHVFPVLKANCSNMQENIFEIEFMQGDKQLITRAPVTIFQYQLYLKCFIPIFGLLTSSVILYR